VTIFLFFLSKSIFLVFFRSKTSLIQDFSDQKLCFKSVSSELQKITNEKFNHGNKNSCKICHLSLMSPRWPFQIMKVKKRITSKKRKQNATRISFHLKIDKKIRIVIGVFFSAFFFFCFVFFLFFFLVLELRLRFDLIAQIYFSGFSC